ncbi:MAG TPA: lyase family protein [Terracidiphilus sp.]|jgi:3-carboxy-cis,cis-muconate cycloisomerase
MPDSLNSFLFSTPEMTRIFSVEEQLRCMMRFEDALMAALERTGLASSGSVEAFAPFLDGKFVEKEALLREAQNSGNIVIPFVRQLTDAVIAHDVEAARCIHLGATSQDVLDTALVLQMRAGITLIQASVARLDIALLSQIHRHRRTILSGRTWLQPGPPTTLGLKLAGVLSALRRNSRRLAAAAEHGLQLQFGGAVGTLASLGNKGPIVSKHLAQLLDLPEAQMPWHTHRDNFVEIVQTLATLTGTLSKFAADVALLMQAEISEASEPTHPGRGGSSTMPHKHNPVSCAAVAAIQVRMPALSATMLAAMPQQHERGLGLWQAEWETMPQAFQLTAAAIDASIQIAEGLEISPARMQANMDALLGLPLAEAVTATLAPIIGRQQAHSLLRTASDRAASQHQALGEVLKKMPEVMAHLSNDQVDRLLDPRNYLGAADHFIARVLGEDDALR